MQAILKGFAYISDDRHIQGGLGFINTLVYVVPTYTLLRNERERKLQGGCV